MPEQSQNKREYFRLQYPVIDRPKLQLNGRDFQVFEISEKGLQFAHADKFAFPMGAAVSGLITFHDGQTVSVSGKFVRYQPLVHIIADLEGIDLQRMLKEQLYLRNKYPEVKSS